MKPLKQYVAAALLGVSSMFTPGYAATAQERVAAIDRTLIKENDKQTIDLKVVVDESFVEDKDWWKKIEESITFASNVFTRDLDMRVEADSVALHQFDNEADPHYLHRQLRTEIDVGEQDAVIAFVGKKPSAPISGVATSLGNHVIIMRDEYSSIDTTTAHELAHLLGAEDYPDTHPLFFTETLMSYLSGSFTDVLDAPNLRIMREHRNRAWIEEKENEHLEHILNSVSSEDQKDAQRLYYYTRATTCLPEGDNLAKRLIKKYPHNPHLHFAYGQILLKREGRERDALLAFERTYHLIKEHPIDTEQQARYINGIAYMIADETHRRKFKNIDPLTLAYEAYAITLDGDTLDTIGWIYHKRGEYALAETILTQAAALATTSKTDILEHVVANAIAQNNGEKIIHAYEQLITQDKENGVHYFNASEALLNPALRKSLTNDDKQAALDFALKAATIYPTRHVAAQVKSAWFLNLRRAASDAPFKEAYEKRVSDILNQYNLGIRRTP